MSPLESDRIDQCLNSDYTCEIFVVPLAAKSLYGLWVGTYITMGVGFSCSVTKTHL